MQTPDVQSPAKHCSIVDSMKSVGELADFEPKSSAQLDDDATPQPQYWPNKIEFFLSVLGFSVGIGNIWRFPYLCVENGGGAFLIPYFMFLFIGALPLFIMEVNLGQFTNFSPIKLFNFSPFFKGIGWSTAVLSCVLSLYYNNMLAYILYYFYSSFKAQLPWQFCNNSWNSNTSCFSYSLLKSSMNMSNGSVLDTTNLTSSSHEFWINKVLGLSQGFNTMGSVQPHLLICLVIVWLITYLCLMRGIKSVGKIVYFTALSPYVLLTILLIRGATLEGSYRGVAFYLRPDFSRLKTTKIWITAATQMFVSLGPGWGGIINMASYNRFDHNAVRDAFAISLTACLTSFYGGFAIFSTLGYMAHMRGESDIMRVAAQGPGLVFVTYPEALTQLSLGQLWSALFFFTLLMLGLDSQFGTLECAISCIVDELYPKFLAHKQSFLSMQTFKNVMTFAVCVIGTLVGVIFTTNGGYYYYIIIDWYGTTIPAILIALFECIAVVLFYNYKKLFKHIELMRAASICRPLKYYLLATWCCITPLALLFVLVSACVKFEPPLMRKNPKKEYPRIAIATGWIVCALSIIPIVIFAIKNCVLHRNDMKKNFKPSQEWLKQELLKEKKGDEIVMTNFS